MIYTGRAHAHGWRAHMPLWAGLTWMHQRNPRRRHPNGLIVNIRRHAYYAFWD